MKVVVLRAVDWTRYPGTWEEGFPFGLEEAMICGIVVSETDDELTIAQVKFASGSWRDVLTLPKSTILDREEFEIKFEGEDES